MIDEKEKDNEQIDEAQAILTAVDDADLAVTKPEAKEDEVKEKKGKPVRKRKKKISRQVSIGRAYVQATYNNTIVTFTDQTGNVLASASAGQCGFKGPKKSTPYAASVIVASAGEKVVKFGLQDVSVFVNGVGSGREAAIRALNSRGFNILQIKDITPIPHNGCRPKKPRRV